MTTSTAAVNAQQRSDKPIPDFIVLPVAANASIFAGTMVALNASGYAIMAGNAGDPTQIVLGRADGPGGISTTADVVDTSGVNGTLTVKVRQGAFWYVNNSSNIAITDIGKPAYAVDDHTIDKTDGAGTRPYAGIITDVDTSTGNATSGKVQVQMGIAGGFAMVPIIKGGGAEAEVSGFHVVRAVSTANAASLTAFSSTLDGLTLVNGDRVLLVNQTTGSQNGIYVIENISAGTGALVRPKDWATGTTLAPASTILVGEGTVGALSRWVVQTTGAITIDTTSVSIQAPQGNWGQMASTAVGTMATPTNFFFAAMVLKPRMTGLFRVDIDVSFSTDTTAQPITMVFLTDTSASGTLASANKAAHGTSGIGAFGTNGFDGETIDTNAGATLTYNGAGFSTAPATQKSAVTGSLTGLLTTNGSGTFSFEFNGIVGNAAPTGATKTPFTLGNTVAFALKATAAGGTITVSHVQMTVTELENQ